MDDVINDFSRAFDRVRTELEEKDRLIDSLRRRVEELETENSILELKRALMTTEKEQIKKEHEKANHIIKNLLTKLQKVGSP